MRKFLLCPVVLLILASLSQAQSITIPATVQVNQCPGLVVVRASVIDADDVYWYVVSGSIQSFPADVVQPKLGTYCGFVAQPGTYVIGVIPAKAISGRAVIGTPQMVTVTVTGPSPAPSSLTMAIQQAYATETDPAKATQAKALADTYRYGASAITDTTITTWGDLYNKMSAKATTFGVTAKLTATQKAIATAELAAVPNSADATKTISDAERTADSRLYTQAAAALDTLNNTK